MIPHGDKPPCYSYKACFAGSVAEGGFVREVAPTFYVGAELAKYAEVERGDGEYNSLKTYN